MDGGWLKDLWLRIVDWIDGILHPHEHIKIPDGMLVGYGICEKWQDALGNGAYRERDYREVARAVARSGLNCFGFVALNEYYDGRYGVPVQDTWKTLDEAEKLIRAMHDAGVRCYVTIIKDCRGTHKYVDPECKTNMRGWWNKVLERVQKWRDEGLNPVVLALAESDGSQAAWQMDAFKAACKGLDWAWNGEGGRPGNVPAGFRWSEWHPASLDSFPRAGKEWLVANDCGSSLSKLQTGGDSGHAIYEVLGPYVETVLRRTNSFWWYSYRQCYDAKAIEVIAASAKKVLG